MAPMRAVMCLVSVCLLVSCGDSPANECNNADCADGAIGSQDARVSADGMPPELVTVVPAESPAIDWTQPIVLTFDRPLSTDPADHSASGSLTDGATYAITVDGNVLTLTPEPHWSDDSARTLVVVARAAGGDASAPVQRTYDVLDGAVHVHPSGDDNNPGTRSDPLATLPAGLSLADELYTTGSVRVAAGTYALVADLVIPTGIALQGGYDPTSWATPANRDAYPTVLRDERTSGFSYAVHLQPDTRLEGFKVVSADGANGCACVLLLQNLTGTQQVIDNELESRSCPETNGIRAISDLASVEIDGNYIHRSGTSVVGEHSAIKLVFNGAAEPAISIQGNDIRVSADVYTTSRGIDVSANTSPASAGTLTISDNHVRGGGATKTLFQAPGDGESYGIKLTMPNLSYSVEANRIYGGTGARGSFGVHLSAPGSQLTLARNAIHGGEPTENNTRAVGAMLSNEVRVWNNLITGGGRVGGVTSGTSTGLHLFSTSAAVYNNTIHHGFLSRGACIALNSGGTRVANNILFAANFLAGQTIAAIEEVGATSSPVELRNNRVQGFGTGSAYVYRNYAAGAICEGTTNYACYTAASALNVESQTTGGAAGTADANTGGTAGFQDVDGPDNDLRTLFDASGNLENDWSLTGASAIRLSGIDGGLSGEAFGFTDDYAGATRTGNGLAGWSIGAFESDG